MPAVYFKSTGTEELLDLVETILIRDINSALNEVYERCRDMDEQRALRRQIPYVPLTYEEVPPQHFHTGNFPSLVLEEVPPTAYPYIVLTIEDYAPEPESARSDHMNVYRKAMVAHCLAKADHKEGHEVVFRRAIRMGEAVYLVLASEPSLRSALAGIDNPTRGQHSIPWTHQHKGRGPDIWFQSVGTSYALRSYTTMHQ